MIGKFVGIPFLDNGKTFDGTDCYGLVQLIFKEELNIETPDFRGTCYSAKQVFSNYLHEISCNWEAVNEPKLFDVVAMAHDPQHPRVIQHFGLYLGNGKMIHTLENIGSHVVELSQMSYYVKGFYRWRPKSSNSTTHSTQPTEPSF